ncbi:hypothetical protein PVAG01_09881 [Phlyctema vagabunda]|uniref:Pathogen-related protein n=1 Tax=Phlyctema vagabunda TaxID=108571 RepID=A0ABR4P4E8_9HELO
MTVATASTMTIPDYCRDPDAVLKDKIKSWRYGRAPDYKNTRKVYHQTKEQDHAPGSLESMVENLVKNWEVEASFKQDINDWRTIDRDAYTFAVNGGKPCSADHMLKVGTYNALIVSNPYYAPEHSDFNSSHKTFKRMMPTFAWEVVEVHGMPPNISFKWRHWGVMKNDYVGFNEAGEKVTVKAHGGTINFYGLTVAKLTDDLRIQSLDTFFNPMEMFEQIGRGGKIEKVTVGRLGKYTLLPGEKHTDYYGMDDHIKKFPENNPMLAKEDSDKVEVPLRPRVVETFPIEIPQSRPLSPAYSHQSTASHNSLTFEEMSRMTPADCPFLMKWRTAAPENSTPASETGDDEEDNYEDDGVNPWGEIGKAMSYETIVETVADAADAGSDSDN